MPDISVIILTFNEEIHIKRCVESVKDIAENIFVVDCFSSDRTIEIAESLGVKVYQNKWENSYAKQFNWAMDNLPIKTKWVLRLDADEYLTAELKKEIEDKLPYFSEEVTGIVFPLGRVFLKRIIKHGTGKIKLLRLFRNKKAICEQRWMDEHIVLLEGSSVEFENDFVDHNLNNLTWWTAKHNGYAIREAIDLLDIEFNLLNNKNTIAKLSPQADSKRQKKYKYAKQPLFLRSFLYFIYRFIFKLGFLDGKEGFLWHFLQGWWYRTLVDAKIFEIKRNCGSDKNMIKEYLKFEYNININE